MKPQPALKAVVVGAGPVGCLTAMSLVQLGWHVTLYERRPDLRSNSLHTNSEEHPRQHPRQRSINLTLSSRGIAAVQAINQGVVERLLHNAVPLQGRLVHFLNGNTQSQRYDRHGQCLHSIDRGLLNAILLDAAASTKNISIHFSHKVESVDFDRRTLHVRNTASSQEIDVDFDLCIGADGSHSVIRRFLMQTTQMEYSQHYLSHEYVEIRMPRGVDTSGQPTFLLDPDHLHVWPREEFTMVALPNKDKTFICALFAPKTVFDVLQSPGALSPFFKKFFPDLLLLLGEKHLERELQNNPRSHLITTKANPYHKGCVVILGDAAHSMVPFYGQGLNCALEDVRVLSILLRKEQERLSGAHELDHNSAAISRVLDRYSESRHNDLVAICDLAMENHLKLRHGVATWSYMIKGFIDNILYAISEKSAFMDYSTLTQIISSPKAPSAWIPLYTMVSFRPDIPYSVAKKKAERQERLIDRFGMGLGILGVGYFFWAVLQRSSM
ncbi:FAD/NAD-binding domain-containing protein [Mycena pura]|uniref:Kynurenine 3-monooxygenase n=1 Tax=Mycena pura TaxID=153505 RepID=A0AAD6YAA1_9AGAR|nr:FAD/NAD-binding domain-containing protein [Mycena pura]